MEKLRQFWEWIFDRHPSDSDYAHNESSHGKASILIVVGFIIITVIVMLAVWIDNYIKYHW